METGSNELITHLQNLLIVTYGNQITHAWLTFLATSSQAKLKLTQFQHPAKIPTIEVSDDFKTKAARLFNLSRNAFYDLNYTYVSGNASDYGFKEESKYTIVKQIQFSIEVPAQISAHQIMESNLILENILK